MTIVDFSIVFIAFVLFGLCISLLFMMSQILRAVHRIETFVDHLDREIVPAIRQIEHITRDADEIVKNTNRQILKVEPSIDLLKDVAEEVTQLKQEIFTKTNKTAVAGFAAALIGVLKGREIVSKYMEKRKKKRNMK